VSPVFLIDTGLISLPSSDRRYKSSKFAIQLLDILRQLNISTWLDDQITPNTLTVRKVSGSLTNAVFFVSCPSVPKTPTLLLRIYGPSSGALISRPRELRTLHALSSQYRIGPKVYGTFLNGRIEEYFDSVTLTPADLRDQKMSRLIGARMAELHSVDIAVVEEDSLPEGEMGGLEVGLGVMSTVKSWLAPARQVLALPSFPDESRKQLDIDRFEEEWRRYTRWLSRTEKTEGPSRRVFSHNDAQAGNLLRLTKPKEGGAEHRQVSDCMV
jgi:choline kinase